MFTTYTNDKGLISEYVLNYNRTKGRWPHREMYKRSEQEKEYRITNKHMKRCPTLVTEECNLKHCLIFIFTGLAKIKTLTTSNVGEMWSNGNFTHCRWVGKMIQSRWFYPYIPYDPLIPFLGYML